MACIIRRARLGDEVNLAYIQTESWKAAFGKILPEDIIQKNYGNRTCHNNVSTATTQGGW